MKGNNKIMRFTEQSLADHITEEAKRLKKYVVNPHGAIIEAYSLEEAVKIARENNWFLDKPGDSVQGIS